MNILLADDEEDLARAVGTILKFSGYNVDIVSDGEWAIENATTNSYDALVLDVMMPKKNGIEVVKELRARNIDTPILMLTAKSEIEDKVDGLDSGANDYLTKPFNKDELLARLRALIRSNQSKSKQVRIGNITLNKENYELSSENASFHLNAKEYQVMEALIGSTDKKIGKEELKNRVWGDEEENNEIVTIYISYLQKKFKALNASVRINEINGYRLENI